MPKPGSTAANNQNITISVGLFDSMALVMADHDLLLKKYNALKDTIAKRDREIDRKEGVIVDQKAQKWNYKRLDSLCEISNRAKDQMLASYAADFKKATRSKPISIALHLGYGLPFEEKPRFKPVASVGVSYTIFRL